MSVMILAAGNSIIKAKTANIEVVFSHAIQHLSEGDFVGEYNAFHVSP